MAIYDDDAQVERLTAEVLEHGSDIFQIFRLAERDDAHVRRLLDFLDPPWRARVIDGGCGVGGVAWRMRRLRPDLDWTLVNISRSQLARCPRGMRKIEASLEEIPVVAGSADAMIIAYALGHVDLERTIEEAARVLASDGVLLIWDMVADSEADATRFHALLDYTLHQPAEIWGAAKRHGFRLAALTNNLRTSTKHFERVAGADVARQVLHGIKPEMYRFTRC